MNEPSDLSGRAAPRWTPSPLLYASGAIHMGAAVAVVLRPAAWPWALGALVANHAVLAAAGLWPRSSLLGANWTELPEGNEQRLAITIDDGPDPKVTPAVLDLLEGAKAQATFFCVGERVRRFPELAREIVKRGHTVENHTQRHRHNFSLLGPKGMAAEIAEAQDSIAQVTGSTPMFFRAPAGLRNPFLDAVLVQHDLKLASWTRRGFDTVNSDPDSVYQRLSERMRGRDILLLHDGHAARSSDGRAVILSVLPRLLAAVVDRKLTPVTLRAALV
jgi:peptidoglycan-N-acetylglucosamine deacetylase